MAGCEMKRRHGKRWVIAVAAASAAILLEAAPAKAQRLPATDCLQFGEPLYRIPVLGSKDGKLTGTVVLKDERRRLNNSTSDCALQFLRFFEGVDAVAPPILPGSADPAPSPVATKYKEPVPGPTLRAQLGDLIQLTFLNQVNPLNFPGTLDRGDTAGACDQFTSGYPASNRDGFPNCLHGSSTANIHFHGTHTNPNSTGDNVFLQIRPSPKSGDEFVVNAGTVAGPFAKFFGDCETRLKGKPLSQWPYVWKDLPTDWTQEQEKLLRAFDDGTTPYFPPPKELPQKLWPENQRQIDGDGWPQYYVGAFPYCFRIPEYASAYWPAPGDGVKMGQAPGTHWYHAHKHGSTALNVSNGMTGAFIIEGKYDDDLNAFYGIEGEPKWTHTQPVLVINQLGVTPNIARGGGGKQPLSVNGRLQPKLDMRPGEVQLWRIVNTSSRNGVLLLGPPKLDPASKLPPDPKVDFQWRQIAQDGVQFADVNYKNSQNLPIMIAPGNRADLLVKAPTNPPSTPYPFVIEERVARAGPPDKTGPLLSVLVSGTAPEEPKRQQFISRAPLQPPFLTDITDAEVRYTPRRTFVFDSKAPTVAQQHTINGEQFTETGIGVTAFLNMAEEWKIVNTTNTATGPGFIDHPFHIHINPFQIVEVFDPNEQIPDPDNPGKTIAKYITSKPATPALEKVQCQLSLDDPDTWKDCHNTKQRYGIWWDVFPIPSAAAINPTGSSTPVIVPGFFRMRSRFVDYPGLWVIHCHILAHEDRGMMTIVQVAPSVTSMRSLPRHH